MKAGRMNTDPDPIPWLLEEENPPADTAGLYPLDWTPTQCPVVSGRAASRTSGPPPICWWHGGMQGEN
jgi:hypothetical protein